jgi:phenylacetate-CoA ligase
MTINESDIDGRLQKVIEVAYKNSPATRERFDAAELKPGDIQAVADLVQVPVLPKDDIIGLQQSNPPFGGLLTVPLSDVRHIYLSPGPIYEPGLGEDRTPIEMGVVAFRWGGFAAGDVVLNSLSYHLVPAGMLIDRALVELGCTVVPGGVGNADLQLKLITDLNINAYAGTPSFLMHLIQRAEEMGLDFKADFQVEKMFATAEPFPAELRRTFVEKYDLSVANCYATAELGLLALDSTGEMAMRLLPEPIIQVVDPDTGRSVGPGEVGEVVVTNFSPHYPLIRFGTGDMAVNVDPKPGGSKQDERAIILVGRSGEAVKVRGMFVHPNQLRFAIQQVAHAKAFQGIVTRPEMRDYFTLRVVIAEGADDVINLLEPLKEAVRSVCRVRLDAVEFVSADAIPDDAPGMLDERSWK